MNRRYSVKKIMASDGNRFCMILDSKNGLPLYYQNIYLSLLYKQKNKSFNTVLRNAYTLIAFENYLIESNINLIERIKSKTFLSFTEIYSLSEQLRVKNKKQKVIDIKEYKKINQENLHYRLTVISSYISWIYESYFSTTIYETNIILKSVNLLFRKHKPKLNSQLYLNNDFKSLEKESLDILLQCLEPESQYNPFVDISCRKRNQLIILILQETGMRGGELLNLKISDFNKEKRYLKVCKRVNDPADLRVFQPLVKTFERELNISKKLSMQISSYIDNDRSFYSKSLNHNYLFITQKSGPTEGFPLSISAYHKVMKQISRIEFCGVSFQNFTGHCLRHTWNYIYSLKYIGVTDQYRLTQLDRIRCVRMGWKMNSKTALIYNNRYISEETLKAFEEADLVNNKIINKIEGEIDESINVRKLLGVKSKRQQK
ncbi:site-specific integrase [Salmonella enterica subsp. enterica serovar Telelkebir]|nr:site-specific integrase [Salmonella enterica subsp. enterica serovar Telelkebir]